ncbi:PA3496 family putative envelope integrity protein [Zooshikella harenae]|uniref:Uncharacterized protein n=1 Tax=Zooshikella harenae TaxID=2827238 RepID=A0ABS5ZGE5_9GAMM|nr:hypothetical protein [Zooshikella harenae]MBU2712848.1 hypothetical protein [Zooshikella harenae]
MRIEATETNNNNQFSTQHAVKSNREKSSQRSLLARRAIEDYFENKRLNSLIGDDYWGKGN